MTAWRVLFMLLLASAPALAAGSALTPAQSQAYLAANQARPGVTVWPSGLQYRILKAGMGRHAGPRDTVQIAYTAKLIDGTVVDGASAALPATLFIGNATPGLSEALQMMREGDRWEITVPPRLAFGAKGSSSGTVPPDQALVFDVTLISAQAPVDNSQGPADGLSINANAIEQGAHWTIHQ